MWPNYSTTLAWFWPDWETDEDEITVDGAGIEWIYLLES